MHANIAAEIGFNKNVSVDEDLIRHMVLNTIRANNSRFRNDYGRLVIALDSREIWRKKVFPFYKARRKKGREESPLDWNLIFKTMDKLKQELKEFMPYPVIDVEGAEADDVIATIVKKSEERVLILSGDRDFVQLHSTFGDQISQWDPVNKRKVRENDPERYALEKIIKGDPGDGVPNVMSPDDCFVTNTRQKPITKNRLEKFCEELPKGIGEDYLLRNFERNDKMINLKHTPPELQDQIIACYQSETGKTKGKMMNYFISNRLRKLMENITDF